MSLAPGTLLGPYRVDALLGAGGMGEVYRATDPRVPRAVAIIVLPADVSADPTRRGRFERETRAIGSLNHPNVCTLYDVGEHAGQSFLVMELVEGDTLAKRLERGALPVDEALRHAIEMAAGLDRAHRAGIVHRDLKPANVMITKTGVKLLDFGLAKFKPAPASHESVLPTLLSDRTAEGTILGTLQYMSPEQLEGQEADSRSDIFAFGAVLYEMITGRKAFDGKSQASVIGAILRDQPPGMTTTQPLAPATLERVVRTCLEKDPDDRFQSAADVGRELKWIADELRHGSLGVVAQQAERSREATARAGRWMWIAATAALVAAAAGLGWWLRGSPPELPRWELTRLTADAGLSDYAALSPDGKLVAYSSDRNADGEFDLYVKQVAGGQPIRLTSDGAGNTMPDFSPDGGKIAFRSDRDGGGIYIMPALGGDVRLLVRGGVDPKFSPDGSKVAYWVGNEGVATAVPGNGTVWVIALSGGSPQRIGANFTSARHPVWSPDGTHVLLLGYTSSEAFQESGIDWFFVPVDGGEPVKTGANAAVAVPELIAAAPLSGLAAGSA